MAPRYSVDYKNALIRYLLKIHREFPDPFLPHYWDFVGRTFAYPDAAKLTGNDVEELLDNEVQTWQIECENDPRKRRKGHEKGSAYDKLMDEWANVWDTRLLDHWQYVVTKPGLNQGKYETVPQDYRAKVRERVAASEKNDATRRKSVSGSATKKTLPKKAKLPPSQTEDRNFEYDGEKLKRVVEAAKSRAREVGKPELSDAVHQIYIDALQDMNLRILLEAILTQRADKQQNDEFQEYVRRAKRKIRDERARDDVPASSKSTPPVQASKTIDKSSAMEPDRPSAPIDESTQGSVDSGYGSQKDDRVGNDSASGTTGSRSPSDMTEAGKRKREREGCIGAPAEQTAEDVEHEAKRRKQADIENDVAADTIARKKAKFRPAKMSSESGTAEEGSSSELSEADDSDIQAAKKAYDGELERRKSGETLRPAIEVDERTLSPPGAGHKSPHVKSSASQRATPPSEAQATAGAANATPAANMSVARGASPPAQEQLTDAESSHAFRIITGAAEEAVAPIIDRLESKLDALMSQRTPANTLEDMMSRASRAKGKEAAMPGSQDLANMADLLQSGDLNLQNPDTTRLISQLARNAAEASIHAAEAARRAGEMARDVSMVLFHLGSKQNGRQSGNDVQRKQE